MIRTATSSDADAVAGVHEVARAAYYGVPAPNAPDSERVAMWRSVIGNPSRAIVLCAERDLRVVGFLSMGPPIHEREDHRPVVEMHALYVLPEHWGTGIGARLHAHFVEHLGSVPDGVGVLDVWDGNNRAIRFYERRGWVRDGRSRPAPDGTAYVGMSLDP